METLTFEQSYAMTDRYMIMYANWININNLKKINDRWQPCNLTDTELLTKFKQVHLKSPN